MSSLVRYGSGCALEASDIQELSFGLGYRSIFCLTPFCQDFIDYTECSIPVNDIARTNTVIGIGTTLHKFKVDGEDIFMPCLSYHLPLADVRLFSPQTFHTLYGGHSTVFGDKVEMFIESLFIGVGINREASNVPMVFDC